MQDADVAKRMLAAAADQVPFDGWSEAAFAASARDAGVSRAEARAVFPRGAVDLALAYHAAGDSAMLDRLAAAELGDMRFRDRIATALRYRLEAGDREMVRRGMALFALPQHAADGARALWQTGDHVWRALGDTSDDINWYTKRATLSGVYGSTVLYWLGDDSPDRRATWEFLDRRIDDVMQIETLKARARANPLSRALMTAPLTVLGHVRAPKGRGDLPGHSAQKD